MKKIVRRRIGGVRNKSEAEARACDDVIAMSVVLAVPVEEPTRERNKRMRSLRRGVQIVSAVHLHRVSCSICFRHWMTMMCIVACEAGSQRAGL